jgi:hypothetical protein
MPVAQAREQLRQRGLSRGIVLRTLAKITRSQDFVPQSFVQAIFARVLSTMPLDSPLCRSCSLACATGIDYNMEDEEVTAVQGPGSVLRCGQWGLITPCVLASKASSIDPQW